MIEIMADMNHLGILLSLSQVRKIWDTVLI